MKCHSFSALTTEKCIWQGDIYCRCSCISSCIYHRTIKTCHFKVQEKILKTKMQTYPVFLHSYFRKNPNFWNKGNLKLVKCRKRLREVIVDLCDKFGSGLNAKLGNQIKLAYPAKINWLIKIKLIKKLIYELNQDQKSTILGLYIS